MIVAGVVMTNDVTAVVSDIFGTRIVNFNTTNRVTAKLSKQWMRYQTSEDAIIWVPRSIVSCLIYDWFCCILYRPRNYLLYETNLNLPIIFRKAKKHWLVIWSLALLWNKVYIWKWRFTFTFSPFECSYHNNILLILYMSCCDVLYRVYKHESEYLHYGSGKRAYYTIKLGHA